MNLNATQESASKLPAIEETTEEWDEPTPEQVLGKETAPVVEDEEAETPTDDAPAPEEETPPGEENVSDVEDIEQIKADAKLLKDMNEAWARDPAAYMAWMAQTMTPAQREVIAAQIAGRPITQEAPKDPTEGWGSDEDLAPSEKFLKNNAIIISDLPRWSNVIDNNIQAVGAGLSKHEAELASLKAELTALKATVQKGEKFREQAAKPVPRSVGNSAPSDSAEDIRPRKGESFSSLFSRVKAAKSV